MIGRLDVGVEPSRSDSMPVTCRLLHEFFVSAARRWPNRVAVDLPPGRGRPDRTLTTYAQLDRQSNAIAELLRARIAGECAVGILLPRDSADLYAAQLAVLKAGAAHVCVEPSFPDERVRDILQDVEAAAVLTDGPGLERAQRAGLDLALVVDVSCTSSLVRSAPTGWPDQCADAPWLTAESLAYLIYTSGTTGRPKGVMIEHRSVANLVAANLEEFRLAPGDRVCQSSSAAYDSSIEETWLAFAAGATLVVMDDEDARSGPDVIPWLRRERISVFCPPPTLLRATGCDDPASALPDLTLLYVGGEALPREVADRWSRGRRMVNGYGPTECTVTCLRDPIEEGQPIAIGRPVRGVRAWVLNESLEEVARGDQGELCISGIGLARGYWRRPESTAEKFITHPNLGRVYRTGDLVHCDLDGRFFCHGRIDAQVKIRGYRIELGEIESRLSDYPGVRAAACRVQQALQADAQADGGHSTLVAFIVPDDISTPPATEDIKTALRAVLPAYMVPALFGVVPDLPTTIGGKLDRTALPRLDASAGRVHKPRALPRNALEVTIEAAVATILGQKSGVSIHDDFFHDLGGDSLSAAQLVTVLRDDRTTERMTVRDIYELRTVAELARRASGFTGVHGTARTDQPERPQPRWLLVTCVQAAWLLAVLTTTASAAWFVGFEVLPRLSAALGLLPLILLAPVIGVGALAVYAPLSLLVAVMVKRLLIGRYRARRAPVWGSFYVRNWLVQQAVRLVPWRMLAGTVFQQTALRALGARIGRRVHIHRGVDLQRGGWDLLEIADEVTISQDAAIRLVELDEGEIVVGPVTLETGATLDTRAGIAGHTVLEAEASLTALSSLPAGGRIPRGERWDGIPARPAGQSPAPPAPTHHGRELSPWLHGLMTMLVRTGIALLLALPLEALTIAVCLFFGVNGEAVWAWVFHPAPGWTPWMVGLMVVLLAVPLTLAWTAVVSKLLGRVPDEVISRWSLAYVRVWCKSGLVDGAGDWLSGTLFWPMWLRWAGMSVGRGCEISTITDVVPELIDIGSESFLADGIYLGGPRIQRGTVTLARTRLGKNTFLGNHVVVPAGSEWPEDILIGIATAAADNDTDRTLRAGTAWFGHPRFELPRREVVEMDRRVTHEPSAIRYWNRVFWELLRFTLPVGPLLLLVAWCRILASGAATLSGAALILIPLVTLAAAACLCLFILALKWTLLGRVRPGRHPLWSCWCSRWDFFYVAWGQYARPILEHLEGTLLLPCYLRAMGMKLGKRVVLGSGFAQVVDPDMITIQDEATVSAMFQAHTFEDRVLKIDRIRIGRRATVCSATVLLYGADIGAETHVAAHSVVMKGERLLPGVRYEGAPSRPLGIDGD